MSTMLHRQTWDDGSQLLRWTAKVTSEGLIRGSSRLGERGGEPECDDGVEEGRTDVPEELGDCLVRQPVERVHLLEDGALGLVAAGGAGEAVGVPVHEAVPEECGRGGVAVHDGKAVGSVIGVRGHGKTLGWAVVGAAVGVAVGRGVGAGALAVLEQFPEEVVESLREVYHPREVEVGVCLGECGATDVQRHAPLPEARVADGVLEGRLTVLAVIMPLAYEVEVEGEQVVWRPGRASEEAIQEAAQPVEPSAVPGVVEAPAVEEIQLLVEAFDDVEEQAEQSVRVAGVEQASRGEAFLEVCVVLCLLNLLADQDIHVATVAVVAQLAVLQSWRVGDLVAGALEESAEFTGCINLQVPPLAAFAAALPQPVEGVAQCGQRGEEDLGAHGAVGRQLCNVSDGDGLCALGSYGLGEGLIFDQGSGERLPGVS
ncbi:RNA polymerase sigma70, putative [Babesia ovata]|uniref:RNA polymerase sigma70, putative n=1 Tax=Babesia ovata TaxID=189622 RepID=A0A2H6KIS5_9APIC|nr:RNA polymerase sigma70, putative [Babesia ovata]GBE62893.1 RNA polymerase sigma70, putative [Babesia ovata]